ncbi:MAG TPA: hypothetical protein VIH99_13395 [Bdellovibrionota bacterium]|jgi:hypothetical protein
MAKHVLWIGLGLLLAGCASLESVDRSYVNQPAMELRDGNILGAPSPASGLRNMKKAGGGESCSVCAK